MEEPYVHKIFIKKLEQTREKLGLSKEGFLGSEPEKAIFAYPIKHYTFWQEEVESESIDMGTMGENFAVLEMDEFTVCIGDTFKIGDMIIQVSQPYQPYWDSDRGFAKQMAQSGRTGWYFRILQEGYVQPGSDMELMEQPYPQWSIAACNEIMFLYKDDLRLADDLASCDLLAKEWKKAMKKRLRGII